MGLCPSCRGPRLALIDAQSVDPKKHLWMLEAFCPDCQKTISGEVSTFQLGALADAVENSFAEMMQASQGKLGSESWLPQPPRG